MTHLVLAIVVIAGLLLVRGAMTEDSVTEATPSTREPDSTFSVVTVRDEPQEVSQPEPAAKLSQQSSHPPAGSAIHVGLTDLVREDPAAAADMLRQWVEKAA